MGLNEEVSEVDAVRAHGRPLLIGEAGEEAITSSGSRRTLLANVALHSEELFGVDGSEEALEPIVDGAGEAEATVRAAGHGREQRPIEAVVLEVAAGCAARRKRMKKGRGGRSVGWSGEELDESLKESDEGGFLGRPVLIKTAVLAELAVPVEEEIEGGTDGKEVLVPSKRPREGWLRRREEWRLCRVLEGERRGREDQQFGRRGRKNGSLNARALGRRGKDGGVLSILLLLPLPLFLLP